MIGVLVVGVDEEGWYLGVVVVVGEGQVGEIEVVVEYGFVVGLQVGVDFVQWYCYVCVDFVLGWFVDCQQ